LAYHGVIPGGGLAAAFHIAPDELTGGAVVLSLLPAALFATWAASGRVGVRSLFRRAFHWRVSPGWWLTVLLGLPVLTVGLALLMGDQLRSINVPSFLAGQLMLLLVNFIVINLWEEVAWTGLFQTRLEERHNWLIAALLTAIPFAAIHLPLQFFLDQPVTPSSLAAAFGLYLLLGVLVRPLLAVFRRGTGDSLLLVGLLHSVFNRTNNENGIAATLLEGDARQLAMLIAVVLLTVVTAVVIRPDWVVSMGQSSPSAHEPQRSAVQLERVLELLNSEHIGLAEAVAEGPGHLADLVPRFSVPVSMQRPGGSSPRTSARSGRGPAGRSSARS
jgi:uncharacterized protein